LQIADGGVHTYDAVWWPSQVLYYTLVVWDALAVLLALRARPAVVPLGVAIMVADLVAPVCVADVRLRPVRRRGGVATVAGVTPA
jgi:hypothetical protein